MDRRHFLKALGAVAAGMVLDEATGLLVPRKKIWAVGAKLEAEPYYSATYDVSFLELPGGATTVTLPVAPEQDTQYVFVDKTGNGVRMEANGELIQVPSNDEVLLQPNPTIIRMEFKNLVWAVAAG